MFLFSYFYKNAPRVSSLKKECRESGMNQEECREQIESGFIIQEEYIQKECKDEYVQKEFIPIEEDPNSFFDSNAIHESRKIKDKYAPELVPTKDV